VVAKSGSKRHKKNRRGSFCGGGCPTGKISHCAPSFPKNPPFERPKQRRQLVEASGGQPRDEARGSGGEAAPAHGSQETLQIPPPTAAHAFPGRHDNRRSRRVLLCSTAETTKETFSGGGIAERPTTHQILQTQVSGNTANTPVEQKEYLSKENQQAQLPQGQTNVTSNSRVWPPTEYRSETCSWAAIRTTNSILGPCFEPHGDASPEPILRSPCADGLRTSI